MIFGLFLEVPIYNIHKQKKILPINIQVFIRIGDFFFSTLVSRGGWVKAQTLEAGTPKFASLF